MNITKAIRLKGKGWELTLSGDAPLDVAMEEATIKLLDALFNYLFVKNQGDWRVISEVFTGRIAAEALSKYKIAQQLDWNEFLAYAEQEDKQVRDLAEELAER